MTRESQTPTSEKIIKFNAVLASALSVAYYGVTTEGQPWYVVGSGVGANLFVNTFAAYHSQKHILELIKQKASKELVATLTIALLLSAPYGLISYLEFDTNKKFLKILAPIFSVLGSFVLNGLALKQVSEEYANIKNYLHGLLFLEKSQYQLQNYVNENKKTLMQLLKVLDYSKIDKTELEKLKSLENEHQKAAFALHIIFHHAQHAPEPTYVSMPAILMYLSYFLAKLIKLSFVLTPLYSALAVACATDRSFQKDFGTSKGLGVSLGNLVMSGEDFLSITGGYALGSAFIDLMSNLFLYRKIGNNLSSIAVLSVLLSIIITSFSGYTAEKQLGQCEHSFMGTFMLFAHAALIANISSVFFNAIYTKNCIVEAIEGVAGKKTENTYALLSEAASADIKSDELLAAAAEFDGGFSETLKQNPSAFMAALFPPEPQKKKQSWCDFFKEKIGFSTPATVVDDEENERADMLP